MTKTKQFICSYMFEGKRYSITIPAESQQKAEWRLNAIAGAKIDGRLVESRQEKAA
jgi:hypothetical protein